MSLARPFLGSIRRLARDENGAALAFTLGAVLFLYVFCGGAYMAGETIRRKAELQNACDAAAYSASVVQADVLSRMAVLNRAMSWSYVQMTRAQMDAIVYRWLDLTRWRFRQDLAGIGHRDFVSSLFAGKNAGYSHIGHTPIGCNFGVGGIGCREGLHDDKDYGFSHYIGMGPRKDELFRVRVGYRAGTYLVWNGSGDFDYEVDGETIARGVIGQLEKGGGGEGVPGIASVVAANRLAVSLCNGMLAWENRQMGPAIQETARLALLLNLPRDANGDVPAGLADDYAAVIVPGVSPAPPEYRDADADADGAVASGYFRALHNTEEDELRFLAMADGVPPERAGDLRLVDYFSPSSGNGGRRLAGGLDQWFVRCAVDEPEQDRLDVVRKWSAPAPYIARGYKNANYGEGASAGSLAQKATGLGVDIHRGNYVFDGTDVAGLIGAIGKNGFPKLSKFLADKPSSPWKKAFWRAARLLMQKIDDAVSPFRSVADSWRKAVLNVVGRIASTDVEPSCINVRSRFPDQCETPNETYGLVSEYEWATANWICCWLNVKYCKFCIHVPLPIAAIHGGAAGDGYGSSGQPLSWLGEEIKAIKKGGGHSRSAYRSTFIGLDGEFPTACGHPGGVNGRGANMLLKGYVRIYGDDRRLLVPAARDLYVGEPAKPWILGDEYFAGGGTTVVGLARKTRNVFETFLGPIAPPGLYGAFEPDTNAAPRLVAFSAARAGYARRTGDGLADGADSVNAGNPPSPRWETVAGHEADGPAPRLPDGMNAALRARLAAARIGCVCGPASAAALRHGWNLSQTDWNGQLLPLRHAFAGTDDAGDWEWDDGAALRRLLERLVSADAVWKSLGEGDGGSLESILGTNPDTVFNLLLKRRIL
ncbi:MAG: hypothetical protein IJV65_02535 [Kiritimatiellae bacterium]|nr:hypothetical protein [Kiritimatiellia bacterium]